MVQWFSFNNTRNSVAPNPPRSGVINMMRHITIIIPRVQYYTRVVHSAPGSIANPLSQWPTGLGPFMLSFTPRRSKLNFVHERMTTFSIPSTQISSTKVLYHPYNIYTYYMWIKLVLYIAFIDFLYIWKIYIIYYTWCRI